MSGWIDETKQYEGKRDALARQAAIYEAVSWQEPKPPLRLTERGEFVCGVALLSALVVVGWAFLWLVAG